MKRIGFAIVVVLLTVITVFTGYLAFDSATAQDTGTWQVAGEPSGLFSLEDWNTGGGVEVSLDDWIESMPDSCDIQMISRGVASVSAYYRCPED